MQRFEMSDIELDLSWATECKCNDVCVYALNMRILLLFNSNTFLWDKCLNMNDLDNDLSRSLRLNVMMQ